MEKGTVLYFGTTNRWSGHSITLLEGKFDSSVEESDFAAWLDNLSNRNDLINKYWRDYRKFSTIIFTNGTWFGINLSPHDKRPGCKTVLFVYGEKLTEAEMVKKVNAYPLSKELFSMVCKEYNIQMHE